MMKLLMVLMAMSSAAQAGPYFRLADPTRPVKVAGAFIDPVEPKNTSAGTAVALVTHSVRDGCILPTVICTDWSPLMAGFSANAGRLHFNVGPAMNMTPLAKRGLLAALNAVTDRPWADGVKSSLGSESIDGPGVTFSFGPMLAVSPIQRGLLLPLNEWRGQFRVFVGADLKF